MPVSVISPGLPSIAQRVRYLQPMLGIGARLVLSSAYESGIGLRHVARIAKQLTPDHAAGLDTYHWFNGDTLRAPLDVTGGLMCTDACWDVDETRLEPIR